jgi:hypothetical protein
MSEEIKESFDTGIVYQIKNEKNGKIYIGKAHSFIKHKNTKSGYIKYGAEGRFKRHISNALSNNIKLNKDCPLLYNAIREYGIENWTCSILKICDKKNLKKIENGFINSKLSYLPEIGYNYLIGECKPISGENKEIYEKNKEEKNKKRAIGGKLRKNNKDMNLPENIYHKKQIISNNLLEGYIVRIKIKGVLYNKSFFSKKDSNEEKLKKAINYLTSIKNTK